MTKTLRKTPDFPRCSAKRKRGHIKTTSSFERLSSAKCLGREEEMLGWGGGGGTPQSAQTLKLPYIHGDRVGALWSRSVARETTQNSSSKAMATSVPTEPGLNSLWRLSAEL
ncbi:hypothetical protein NQZ68_004982 [Dissostichus eleginoides]|nr:hypothetical protein NQZ68_004982 [Dissostichus eleginoides]